MTLRRVTSTTPRRATRVDRSDVVSGVIVITDFNQRRASDSF